MSINYFFYTIIYSLIQQYKINNFDNYIIKSIMNEHIYECEVDFASWRSNNNKAIGRDGIPNEMFEF